MNKNKSIKEYLKKYKWAVIVYIIVSIISAGMTVAVTITFAKAIEEITLANYTNAIIVFAFTLGCTMIRRATWIITNAMYFKYSTKIMSDLNLDLAKQAFKLNSQTYSNNETGTFVQRIVNEPKKLVKNLADVVSMTTEIISGFVIVCYIMTLNVYIGLIVFAVLLVGLILEIKRIKAYKSI